MRSVRWPERWNCAKRWRRFSTAGLKAESPRPDSWKYWKSTSILQLRTVSLRAGESHLIWSWSGAEPSPEIPLWKLAQAASDLLLSSDAELVKDCGDPTCRWLFLDVSKNHTRRWCDMKTCGNRMKARRHQARYQGSEASL